MIPTLEKKLQNLKNNNKKIFIPFITAGYPSLATTEKLILAMEQAGADAVEIGIPFSDPIADGPVIQNSSFKALQSGATLIKIFNIVKQLRQNISIPIIFMSSYNPIYKYGVEKFAISAEDCGVSGVIVPDLPPEEADDLIKAAKQHNLATIFLFTPTSSEKRIKLITQKSSGFIYYVSLTGVTGIRNTLSTSIKEKIDIARKYTNKPIAVGFGISTPDQAQETAKIADGVIVGSAIIKEITSYIEKPDEEVFYDEMINKVGDFAKGISDAVHIN